MEKDGNDSQPSGSGTEKQCTKKEKFLQNVSLCRINLKLFGKDYKRDEKYTDMFQPKVPEANLSDSTNQHNPQGDGDINQLPSEEFQMIVNNIYDYLNKLRTKPNQHTRIELIRVQDLVIFKKVTSNSEKLLSFYGVEGKNTSHSILAFLPIFRNTGRLSAVYLLSGGSAWHWLCKLTDYDFLSLVPLQIGGTQGVKCYNVQCLLGNILSTNKIVKKEVSLKNLGLGEVCNVYVASVSQDLCINQTTMQQYLFPDVPVSSELKFKVSEGFITFTVEASMKTINHLVHKLECIFTNRDKFPICENSGLNRLMLKVTATEESALKKELNNYLCQNMQKCKDNPEYIDTWNTEHFDICHRLEEEFVAAPSIQMRISDKQRGLKEGYISLNTRPSFASVLPHVLRVYINHPFEGVNLLKTIELSFQGESKRQEGNLFDYLRGQFYSETSKNYYWLLNKKWYFISKDAVMEIQRRFQDVLKCSLLPHTLNEPPLLVNRWNYKSDKPLDPTEKAEKKKEEAEYNNMYKDEPDYYVGDQKTPQGIEYFDIAYAPRLEVPLGTTYLYHVKIGFAQKTRDVCSQVNNAAQLLESAKTGTPESFKDVLGKLSESVFNKNDTLCEKVLGLGPLHERRTLTYVVALQTHKKLSEIKAHAEISSMKFTGLKDRIKYRSLFAEKDLQQTLSLQVIQKWIEEDTKLQTILKKVFKLDDVLLLSNKLKDSLIRHEYFKLAKSDNAVLQVLPKLLYLEDVSHIVLGELVVNSKSLTSGELKYFSRKMRLLLQNYASYFESSIARLEIIRCSEFLKSLGVKDECFKICEILVNNTNDTLDKNIPKPSPEGNSSSESNSDEKEMPDKQFEKSSKSTQETSQRTQKSTCSKEQENKQTNLTPKAPAKHPKNSPSPSQKKKGKSPPKNSFQEKQKAMNDEKWKKMGSAPQSNTNIALQPLQTSSSSQTCSSRVTQNEIPASADNSLQPDAEEITQGISHLSVQEGLEDGGQNDELVLGETEEKEVSNTTRKSESDDNVS